MSGHITHFSLLVPGNFDEDDPLTGLEQTLDLIVLAERLGYHAAWVRQRHLERGISSASVFLAAAGQRTQRIGLGSAVIQMGYENPFRLAEDLAMVDVLSRGRLHVGVSAGAPPFGPLLKDLLYDGPPERVDFSHARVERLARALRSESLAADAIAGNAAGRQVPRLQPIARGLDERLWYGAGSERSAQWSGQAGFNLLTGNIVTGETTDDFSTAQMQLIATFRKVWSGNLPARIGLGRVILPTDSADRSTRLRYEAFAASRHGRTLSPQGTQRTLFAPDLVGPASWILERLAQDPVFASVEELRLELPYEFPPEDYAQIISDAAVFMIPALAVVPIQPRSHEENFRLHMG